jgi:hypothetical protein
MIRLGTLGARGEEARLAGADPHAGSSAQADRRKAVTEALRQHGKTVGG